MSRSRRWPRDVFLVALMERSSWGPPERAVLQAYAWKAGPGDSAWLTVAELKRLTGMGATAARESRDRVVGAGWLVDVGRGWASGPMAAAASQCRIYRLPTPEELQGAPSGKGTGSRGPKPVDNRPQGHRIPEPSEDRRAPESEPKGTGMRAPRAPDSGANNSENNPLEISPASHLDQRAHARDDDGRRYAAAKAELQRLPDFGTELIEKVRSALPGQPDMVTLVITAGDLAREQRRSA